MTGRQYLFKQVGHAFACLGYIVKWYNQYHKDYGPQFLIPESYKLTGYHYLGFECPVCKFQDYFTKQLTESKISSSATKEQYHG